MDELIERVARAICREQYKYSDPEPVILDWVDGTWRQYIPHAQAAIAALRPEFEDSGRLGWVINNKALVTNIGGVFWCVYEQLTTPTGLRDGPARVSGREAIDAARQERNDV